MRYFLLAVILFGCATYQPGDPKYSWLNGKWITHRSSGWITELDLRVVDGNKVTGTNIQTTPDGAQGFGDVSGKVEGDKVNFEVYFPRSGNTYTYTLSRNGDRLEGRSTTGSVALKKQ